MLKSQNITQKIKKSTELSYLYLVIFHALIGLLIFNFLPLSYAYILGILVFFILKIILSPKDPFIVIQAAVYVMAAEVFLRMTGGLVFYETGKYAVILFIIFGLYFHNFHSKAYIYAIYILLLIPGVIVTYFEIDYETNFRKTILFSLSGPLCLFISALFCSLVGDKTNFY